MANGEERDYVRTVTKAAACSVAIGAIAVVAVGCGSSSTSYNAPTVTNSAIQTNSQGQTITTPAAAAAQGGAGASSASSSSSGVVIATGTVPGLGAVVTNGQGQTVYMFVPDAQKKVTCGTALGCSAAWPTVSGTSATAGTGIHQSLLGSDPNPAGGSVITYNKWPLYTYVGDTGSGTAVGQGVNANGGLWYVLSPSGAVIKTKG